jgi:hypothetical protein
LAEHSFYSWRRKLRPENPAADVNRESLATAGGDEASAVKFLPVRVLGREVYPARPESTETAEPSSIEIVLGGSRLLRVRPGFDHRMLLEVLVALEGQGC